VSLCIFAGPAIADETGFYVGANAVSLLSTYRRPALDREMTAELLGVNDSYVMGTSSVERAHFTWDVNVGYMLTRNFGVELSFLDLGPFRYSGFGTTTSTADGTQSLTHLDLDVRSHGPGLAVVGALPMTNFWELDARLGAMQIKTKSNYQLTENGGNSSGALSENSTSMMASVGTAFTVTPHIVLRMDYLRVQHIKEQALGLSYNVDAVTAGIQYVF
jgi:opacity protein-like surface antigen